MPSTLNQGQSSIPTGKVYLHLKHTPSFNTNLLNLCLYPLLGVEQGVRQTRLTSGGCASPSPGIYAMTLN